MAKFPQTRFTKPVDKQLDSDKLLHGKPKNKPKKDYILETYWVSGDKEHLEKIKAGKSTNVSKQGFEKERDAYNKIKTLTDYGKHSARYHFIRLVSPEKKVLWTNGMRIDDYSRLTPTIY
jgi:hypothetical protein